MKLNNKGETLAETLVSIMIIALVITGFSSVLSSVVKANEKIKLMRMSTNVEVSTISEGSVSVTNESGTVSVSYGANEITFSKSVDKDYSENTYYYYEANK